MTPAISWPGPALLERDRGLVWHPYAALDGPSPYAVRGASANTLLLESADGTRYEAIDAMSSWWCAIHGYRHPLLDAALRDQADRFSHVMFGGLTHEPAVRLAEQLVGMAPPSLAHVFFADSGSVSIEVALKLAVQYQHAVGRPQRRQFVSLKGAYHGDTTGAMSVCDPQDGMHGLFPGLVASQFFLPRPPAARLEHGRLCSDTESHEDRAAIDAWAVEAERLIAQHSRSIAAIVVEPVLQGAGGMHMYPPRCLAELRRLADEQGLLLIADEVATGFGRTGIDFAVSWAGVTPDVMCVGKALTGGYLTLAAVMCTSPIADAISRSSQPALLHGPTFMANPLACAVASASLSLIDNDCHHRIGQIGEELAVALRSAAELDTVKDVRVLGAVGVVQLTGPVDLQAVTRIALENGVWVRPFRDLVYTMPPYTVTSEEVAAIGNAITAAVAEVHG